MEKPQSHVYIPILYIKDNIPLQVFMTTKMSESRFHFLLLLYCVFTSSFFMIEGLACRHDQIQALVRFKNEFDSGGCNRRDYFNGVLCDNITGVVTELQVPSGCFTGILKHSSSLFELHHLRYLNLSHNNFTSSSLPIEFSNLYKLEVLSLSSNGFLGQVPSSFGNLTKLNQLDLSHNDLTGNFQLVQNLTKLSFLDLSYNHFSGTIPTSLLTMPFLSHLDLRENYLTGHIEVLNSSSSRLEHLFLGHNHFEGQILEPISKLITLKVLDLSFLNVSYPIDIRLFASLKSLVNFELSGNILSATSLSSDFDIPPKLYRLKMKNCNISEFPKFLKTLQNLERLDLSDNRIKGKVPEWLWSLPRLSIVALSNNSFNRFEGSAEILLNSSVTMLEFSLNAFTGSLPVPPLSINLFSAWNNSFTGDIPLSFCNRSSLDILELSYNNLSGSVPPCLSKVTTVNLRKNNLQGSLPDTFYSKSLLQSLDVGYNQISGKLPRSLVNCSFLKFLSVEHNNVKDVFPFWLKVLPDLQVLTLRSNRFYGHISPPQGPLGFPNLRILEISDNSFTGSLTLDYFVNWSTSSNKIYEDGQMYMGDYKNALYQFFYTSDLQYKGLKMENNKVLTFYSTIDLSGNRLEGWIPESIGVLKELIALNLSNNAFTGHIPLSLANITELESLDLSRNKLSGKIPQELRTISFLAYINVSHNQLEGEIPQGPQISGQPKSSFEGNAGLCGLPLKKTCFDTSAPATQHQKQEEEELLNWKAVVIGYGPGVLLGLAIAQLIASYKPEWLVKIIGPKR